MADQSAGGNAQGVGCLIFIALIVGGAIYGWITGSSDDSTQPDSDTQRYAAFDVCTQFVEDRLRSPSTAEFPNEFEDDGEVVITGPEGANETFVVRSHVDSQNGFGAVVRSDFTCQVVPTGGDNWRLVDMNVADRDLG